MSDFLLAHEVAVRLGAFSVVFAAMALWELRRPLRSQVLTRARRWPHNLALVGCGTVVVRWLFPAGAVGVAALAARHDWGLFTLLELPAWLAFPAALLLLDLTLYLQHALFHAVPALWRLHRVHHADLEFDLTTGLRFHPIELVLSMLIKLGAVAAIGAPVAAVLLFEVLLNASSLFNHGNVQLPGALERVLRCFVVTPDMHRVHHSSVPRETNSNFGFNLSCWDRCFGTYRAEPAAGQLGLTIGVDAFREPRELRLDRLLLQPFLQPDRTYALGRRESAAP